MVPSFILKLFYKLHEDEYYPSYNKSTYKDNDIPSLEPNRSDTRSFSYGNLNNLDDIPTNSSVIANRISSTITPPPALIPVSIPSSPLSRQASNEYNNEQLILDKELGYIPLSTYQLWNQTAIQNSNTNSSNSNKQMKPKVRYS